MKKYHGFSIVELMIGLAIGLVVVGTAGTFFINTLRDNIDEAKQLQFEQAIQIIKNSMVSTIRRAGYSNSTTNLPDVTGWTSGWHYYSNGSCALVTYVDTTLSVPKQQYFGYKLDNATGILYSYQSDNKVDCTDTGTWQAINDPTEIKFSEVSPDTLFMSLANPKLIQVHFIANDMQLSTGGSPVSREVLVKVFIRNS